MTGTERQLLHTELQEPVKVSSDSPKRVRTYRRYVEVQPHNQENTQAAIELFKSVSLQETPAAGSNELSYLMLSELEESKKQSDVVTGSLLKGFSYEKQPKVVKTKKNYMHEVLCSMTCITEYSYKEAKTVHSLEDKRAYYDGYNIK